MIEKCQRDLIMLVSLLSLGKNLPVKKHVELFCSYGVGHDVDKK